MKAAIIGYGKMGHSIEEILKERGHDLILKVSDENFGESTLAGTDIAFEFTRPEAAFGNIRLCFEQGVPVVVGTTGWLQHYEEATRLCKQHEGALLYASNFSLGVNLFFQVNRYLARLMAPQDQYQISLEETHHLQKKDAPSGTAISLAEQIEEEHPRVEGWTMQEKHAPGQIPVRAKREAEVPGIHKVSYDSPEDFIEIAHHAKGRRGFALGAVLAGEFLKGKTGIYSMQDVLNLPQ